MCGICGFYTKNQETLPNLIRMNTTMAHRRLAIRDLSKLGHQPMYSDNGRIEVVFNGEIYNFAELREEMTEYPFKSHCDTEVVLAAYLIWGIEFVEHLEGMFAIVLFDKEDETLYLVRNRIEKKPLYYYLKSGNFIMRRVKTVNAKRRKYWDVADVPMGNF